jgi:hypothetical protein
MLGLALPAAATAQAPETMGWHVTTNGADRYVQLDGRLPNGVTCANGRPAIRWGLEPGTEGRTDYADSSETCWAGDFHGRAYDWDVWGGTTYWYRAVRIDCCEGQTKTFVTPDQTPWVEEGWASEVDDGAATFRTSMADGGAQTTWRVRYGVKGEPLDRVTPTRSLAGDGGPPEDVAEPVAGLQPGTVYEFRFEATNSVGETIGPSYTLTTSSSRPSVLTLDPQDVTGYSARFRAMVDANGRPTQWGYCLQIEPWPPDCSSNSTVAASFDPVLVDVNYSGLAAGYTYKHWFTAENDLGQAPPSNVVTFVAEPRPASASPASPAPSASVGNPPPLVPVSPGGKVVPPTTNQPFRANADSVAPAALATAVARAVGAGSLRALRSRSGLRLRGVKLAGRVVTLRSGARVIARGRTVLRLTARGRQWLRGRRSARLKVVVAGQAASVTLR